MRIVLLLLVAFLAGCSDKSDAGGEAICDDCGQVTETTGVIRGVVVDQAIVPLEGATVRISGIASLEATTDAEGIFFFEALEPGAYFIEASKPGYGSIQQSVEVQAGVEPDVLRIQIQFIPGAAPYYEILPFRGFLECNFVAGFFFVPCEVPGVGSVGDDQYMNIWELPTTPEHMHVGLDWEPTQAFGTELYMNVFEPDAYDIVAFIGGTGPLVLDLNQTDMAPLLAANQFAVEVSGNGESATLNLAGASVQQDFDVFVVLFYNFTPEEGYNYFEDGDPTLPGQR